MKSKYAAGLRREFTLQCLIVLQATALVFAHVSGAKQFLPLDQYLDGSFEAPYQYRILCALLAAPLVEWVETSFLMGMLEGRQAPFNNQILVVFMLFNWISLILIVNLQRLHLRRLIEDRAFADFASLGLFYVLPFVLVNYFQSNYWLPYDIPGVLFFYALFLLGASGRWWFFLGLLPFAILNRETVIFVSGLFFLKLMYERRIGMAMALAVLSGAIFLLIKAYLHSRYGTAAKEFSGLIELNVGANLSYLANPMWWPQVLAVFGFLWIPVYLKVKALSDADLRWAVLAFPLYFLVMMFVGQIVEVRIFTEYTPIFCAAFVVILYRFLQADAHRRALNVTRPLTE